MGELVQLQDKREEFAEAGIAIIAVAVDRDEDLARAKADASAEFPFLTDSKGELMDLFGLRHAGGHPFDGTDIHRPASILLSKNGRLLMARYADNYRVRPTARQTLEAATEALGDS